MNITDKYYEMARQEAHKSVFSKKNFRMCAIYIKGGAVISKATNGRFGHAERRCIRPSRNCPGGTLYIARVNGLCSKPCPKCMDAIIAAGVRAIVYINKDNHLVKEYLR